VAWMSPLDHTKEQNKMACTYHSTATITDIRCARTPTKKAKK